MAEWEVRKALAGQSAKKVEEIQKMMPDDFNRKLKEWELMKGAKSGRKQRMASMNNNAGYAPKKKKSNREHKTRTRSSNYEGRTKNVDNVRTTLAAASSNHPSATGNAAASQVALERDSIWVEKELHKIQREKQRLERERAKFVEREQK